ncbi:hypothetical protein PNOK_0893600 [Pyrrhoderma noxium]|uniref:BTB domain-containing protein n=1 Tax=Pyrrhoderma noxium TaxID=2282107 RepID=A0A286U6H3_9AGAM|nr:hypothetical protein PNOK_0893600 [Pyrrhoderma noxium]
MVRATSSTGSSPTSVSSSSSSAPVKAKSTYSLPASLYMGNSSNKEKEKTGKMSASEIQVWDQAAADKQTRGAIQTGSRALGHLQSQAQGRARSTRVRRRVEKRHGTLWFKDGTLVIRAKSSCVSSGESSGGSKHGGHTKDSKRIAKTNNNNNDNNKSKRCYRGREREDEYVLFKVHQSTLEMHSPVFCDVFGLYSSLCGRSPVDGCNVGAGHGELGEDLSLEASVLSLEEGLDGLPTSHTSHTSEECSQSDEESEEEDAEEEWTSVHEMLEGAPLVDVPESAEDWAEILRLLYGDFFLISSQPSSPNPNLELTLLRPMRLAKKYSMDKIIHQLSAAVLAQWPRSLLAYQNYISGISAAISSSGANTPEPSPANGSRTKMGRNHDFVCVPPPHLEPAAAITLANEHESLKSILPIAFYMLSLRSPFVNYPDSSHSSSVYPTSTSGAGAGAGSTSTSGGAAYLEGARWDLLSSADMRRLYAGQANLRSLIWDKLVCAASSGSGEPIDVGMGGVVPEPPYMFLLPLFQQSCGEAPTSGRGSRTRDDQQARAAREDHHRDDGDPNSDNSEMLENEATREVECSSNGIRMNNELAEYLYCVDPGCVEGRKMVREKIFMSYVNFYDKKGVLVDLLLPGASITGGGGVGGGRKLMAGGGWQGPVDLEGLLEVLGESEGDGRGRGKGIKLCSVCVLAIRTWARNGGGGGGSGGSGSGGGGGSGTVRGHHHIDGTDDRRAAGRMAEKARKRGREEVVWCELGNVFGFGFGFGI